MEVLRLEKNAATEQAAAEKAVNDAKTADAIKTARLEAAHATEVKALQEKAMNSRSPSPALRAATRASILPLLVLSLAACQVPTKPVLVNRDPPPLLTQACPAEPPRNDPFADDNEMFIWISRAIEAGRSAVGT